MKDLVSDAILYDIESEKRMAIAIDIAVHLRAIFGSSNGGTLISKTGYDKEVIFPFYNAMEPLNLLPTYLLVASRIKDGHATFISEVYMKKERVPVVYLSYDSWINEVVVNYKIKDYEPLSRLKVIKILADNLGAHVDSKIDEYIDIIHKSNIMPAKMIVEGLECTVNCENLLTETTISIAKELIFAYEYYFKCKLKRIGVETKAHFYKVKYKDSNSYVHSIEPLVNLQNYCDEYFGGEQEEIIVGIYRMHYLKSRYYEVKLINK